MSSSAAILDDSFEQIDALEQLNDAFDLLDSHLAESRSLTQGSRDALAARSNLRIAHSRGAAAGPNPVQTLFGIVQDLTLVERRARQKKGREWIASEEGQAFVSGLLATAQKLCAELQLDTAAARVEFAGAAHQAADSGRLAIEAEELLRHLRYDLRNWSLCRRTAP